MVKNTKGGSGHKRLARKHQSVEEERIRYPSGEQEMIGRVTKLLGNRMCYVKCFEDGKERLAHIRKKFSGRNKKMNYIGIDTYVLVGLREWDMKKDKQQCDILEVYSSTQETSLKPYIRDDESEDEYNIAFDFDEL